MAFAQVAVFFEGVLDGDWVVADVLSVHGGDGGVGMFEVCVFDKGVAFGFVCLCIPHDVWSFEKWSEGGKGIVKELFVDFGVEIADEEICAYVLRTAVYCGLGYADAL